MNPAMPTPATVQRQPISRITTYEDYDYESQSGYIGDRVARLHNKQHQLPPRSTVTGPSSKTDACASSSAAACAMCLEPLHGHNLNSAAARSALIVSPPVRVRVIRLRSRHRLFTELALDTHTNPSPKS